MADRIAEVTVTQVFRNTFADPIEAVYTFPLYAASVVSRFEMQVGDHRCTGSSRSGDGPRADQQALEQGRRAALLEQECDDVFTIQLGTCRPVKTPRSG